MPRPEPWSPHEHDTDAVYINRVDVILGGRSSVADESATSLPWIALPDLPTAILANPPREVQRRSHPPPALGDPCPLFLRHLALLI
jgi:hypothetical protein